MNATNADTLLAELIAAHGGDVLIALAAAAFRADCANNPPEDGGWEVDSVEDHRDWMHCMAESIEAECGL